MSTKRYVATLPISYQYGPTGDVDSEVAVLGLNPDTKVSEIIEWAQRILERAVGGSCIRIVELEEVKS